MWTLCVAVWLFDWWLIVEIIQTNYSTLIFVVVFFANIFPTIYSFGLRMLQYKHCFNRMHENWVWCVSIWNQVLMPIVPTMLLHVADNLGLVFICWSNDEKKTHTHTKLLGAKKPTAKKAQSMQIICIKCIFIAKS